MVASLWALVLAVALLAAGCGGGGGGGTSGSGSGTAGTSASAVSTTASQATLVGTSSIVANGSDGATVRVVAVDASGNPLQGAPVTWTVGSGTRSLRDGNQEVVTDSNGVATFVVRSTSAGTFLIVVYINGVQITGSLTVTFVAGPPARLTFAVQPSAIQAASLMQPAVQVAVEDVNGNRNLDASVPITVALGPGGGGGALFGTQTVTSQAGLARFDSLTVDAAGTGYTLVASAAALASATSAPFTVTGAGGGGGGGSPYMAFLVEPVNTVAGQVIAPAVKVKMLKPDGSVDTSSTAQVTLTLSSNPGSAVLAGTTVTQAVGGVATFSDLSLARTGTGYRLRASVPALVPATSAAFDVTPGPAQGMSFVVQPSAAQAGVSLSPAVQVAVVDSLGNVCTGASDAITLSLSTNPSAATLRGTLTVSASLGIASFSDLQVNRTGAGYRLGAVAAGLPGTTSSTFDISAGPPSSVTFTQQPIQATAGLAMTAVKVSLLDPEGNLRTTANDRVRLAIGPNPPASGVLSGTVEVAAVAGVATFSDLSLDKKGQGYTLVATSPGYTGDTSAAFDVVPGSPSVLAFTTSFANAVAGVDLQPIDVELRDNQGNVITGTDAVTLVVDQGPGILKGTVVKNAVAGVARFDAVHLETAGTYRLSATATGYSGAPSGAAFDITPAAAAGLAFTAQPVGAQAGQSLGTVKVAVRDAYGNPVGDSTASVTVEFATDPSSGVATLGGTTTQAAVAGVATFSDLAVDKAFDGFTLQAKATLGGTPVTSAPSTAFNVSAGPAAALRFVTGPPASVDTGQPIVPAIEVAVEDASGNRVRSSTATITLALTDGSSAFPPTFGGSLSKAAVQGVATYSDLTVDVVHSGYKLKAMSAGLPDLSSSAFDVVFGAGPTTWYVDNTAVAGGTGQQFAPFNNLAAAGTASRSGDTILVLQGDGTTSNQNGIALKSGVALQGQGSALIGPVILASACSVTGLSITSPGGAAVSGTSVAGATVSNVVVQNSVTALSLTGATGTIAVSGLTASTGVGSGVTVLNSPDAVLQFSNLTVVAGNGPGLSVQNASAGAGTLSCTGSNAISATDAPALNLLRVAVPADLAFTMLSSTTSTTNGVRLESLTGLGGLAVATSTTATNPGESGILVKNCGTSKTFDFAATTVTGAGTVSVVGHGVDGQVGNNGSTFVFATLDAGSDNGSGLVLGASAFRVNGGVVTATSAPGLDLNGTTVGSPCTFGSVSSTGSTGPGLRLDNLSGANTLTINGGGIATAAGDDVSVSGGSAGITYAGNVTNTAGRAVSVTARTAGTITLSGTINDGSGSATGRGIVYNSNSGGTLQFNGAVTVSTGTGAAVSLDSNTGGTLRFAGSLGASTTSGTTVTSTSSGATLDIAGGGSLTATTGTAFLVNGSFPVVTCNATVTSNSARVASIQGLTGGSVTLTGNLVGNVTTTGTGVIVNGCSGGTVIFGGGSKTFTTGANPAVTLTGNAGATVRFTGGGLAIQTGSGNGFVASGGGTVEVSGANNTLSTTAGGTALSIANTSIGVNGLTFRSIGTASAAQGIVLNTTGSLGGLLVTGDGNGTANGSGGALNGGGTAVEMTSASTVTLRSVDISNTTGPGIRGSDVTNLRLERVRVTGCGDNNGGAAPYDQGVQLANLRGANSAIVGCTFTASTTAERLVQIANSVGTGVADILSVTGSTFTGTINSPVGASTLELTAEGNPGTASNFTVGVDGCTFQNAATNGVQERVQVSGRAAVTVQNSTFTNVGSCVDMAAVNQGTLTFNVSQNPTMFSYGGFATNVVNLYTDDTATATGKVNDNPDMRGGGAGKAGNGIRFDVNNNSSAIVEVRRNTLSNVDLDYGILGRARLLAASLQATLDTNTVTVTPNALGSIRLEAGSGTDTAQVIANVLKNNCGSGTPTAFILRLAGATNTIRLQGFVSNAATTWNNNLNTPLNSVLVSNPGGGTVTGGTPATPP